MEQRASTVMCRAGELVLDFLMALFAVSSVMLWGVLVCGGSFRTVAMLVLGAPVAALYLVMKGRRGRIAQAPPSPVAERYESRFDLNVLVTCGLLAVIFHAQPSVPIGVMVLVVVYGLMRQGVSRPPPFVRFSKMEQSPWMLLCAVAIAITYTLVSHRPDLDDALYVFYGIIPLDRPDEAMNAGPLERWYDKGRLLTSHSTLKAVITYWTGIDYLKVYYLVVPAVAAALCPLAYHRLFRYLNPANAALLALMAVILLILWGDVHRSPGNYAFVRLFQGKAMLHTVVLPYLMAAAVGTLTRRRGSAMRLALGCIAGAGMSQSFLVLGPLLLAGLILAACCVYRTSPAAPRLLPLVAALLVVLALAAALWVYLGDLPRGRLHPTGFRGGHRDWLPAVPAGGYTLRGLLELAYGEGLRGVLAVASLGLLPLLAVGAAGRRAAVVLGAGAIVVALNPIVIDLVGHIVWSLGLRLQWLLPLVPGLAAGIFLCADHVARGKAPYRLLLCAYGLLGFAALGPTTFTVEGGNRIGIPQIKAPPTIDGLFHRNVIRRYKLDIDYQLRDGRICTENGCY